MHDFYNAILIVVYRIDRQSDTVKFKVSLILWNQIKGMQYVPRGLTTKLYFIVLCSFVINMFYIVIYNYLLQSLVYLIRLTNYRESTKILLPNLAPIVVSKDSPVLEFPWKVNKLYLWLYP